MLVFFRPAFQRYTQPAVRAVWWAVREAHRAGARRLTVEHLVLGLIRQDAELVRNYVHGSRVPPLIRAPRIAQAISAEDATRVEN